MLQKIFVLASALCCIADFSCSQLAATETEGSTAAATNLTVIKTSEMVNTKCLNRVFEGHYVPLEIYMANNGKLCVGEYQVDACYDYSGENERVDWKNTINFNLKHMGGPIVASFAIPDDKSVATPGKVLWEFLKDNLSVQYNGGNTCSFADLIEAFQSAENMWVEEINGTSRDCVFIVGNTQYGKGARHCLRLDGIAKKTPGNESMWESFRKLHPDEAAFLEENDAPVIQDTVAALKAI